MKTASCPKNEILVALATGLEVAPEIKEHVRDCAHCQACLQRLKTLSRMLDAEPTNTNAEAGTIEAPKPPSAELWKPEKIGRYLIIAELGKGGQGRVFRGVHPTLQRDVAIKWSLQPLQAGSDQDRLAAEGQLLAQLEHPSIVHIYDLDTHMGRPFLVMEFVRGPDLQQYTAQRPLSAGEAVQIVLTIARAVQAAHAKGITHQDIKPNNILIDEQGRPRLTDFGMARLQDIWSKEQDQPIGGTMAFMAPEQFVGDPAQIGPRTDIYGLGGVLYFLLTGRPPRLLSPQFEVASRQVLTGRIDELPLEQAAAPARLKKICRKALAADPNERHESAAALAAELERNLTSRGRTRSWLVAASLLILCGTAAWGITHFLIPAPGPTKKGEEIVNPVVDNQPKAKEVPIKLAEDIFSPARFEGIISTDLKKRFDKKSVENGFLYDFQDSAIMIRFDCPHQGLLFFTHFQPVQDSQKIAHDWNVKSLYSRACVKSDSISLEVPLSFHEDVPAELIKEYFGKMEEEKRIFAYEIQGTLTIDDIDKIVEKDLFKKSPMKSAFTTLGIQYTLGDSLDIVCYYPGQKKILFFAQYPELKIDLEKLNRWNERTFLSRAYANLNNQLVLEIPLYLGDLPAKNAREAILRTYQLMKTERSSLEKECGQEKN